MQFHTVAVILLVYVAFGEDMLPFGSLEKLLALGLVFVPASAWLWLKRDDWLRKQEDNDGSVSKH